METTSPTEPPTTAFASPSASWRLFAAGITITLGWLGFWVWVLWGRWKTVKGMELNAIGDFMAGAFAPLAFMWLVLGFIQQGIELRQNAAALRLQAQELHAAAQHAGGLLDVAKKEHDLALQQRQEALAEQQRSAEAAARRREENQRADERREVAERARRERTERAQRQPDIKFSTENNSEGAGRTHIKLLNLGKTCSELRFEVPENELATLVGTYLIPVLAEMGSHTIVFEKSAVRHGRVPIFATYSDKIGEPGRLDLVLSIANGYLEIEKQRSD